jgi:tungstate transport system substrate-binding protein
MRITRRILGLALIAATLLSPVAGLAQDRFITMSSTTSTAQSGLFNHILPQFTNETGIAVRVVALGTGQALELGRRGDVDVLLVHDKASEEKFVADGFAEERRDVMYNDFVIVGPRTDPAGVKGLSDAPAALKQIAEAGALFASRGDDSGTHKAEQRLWSQAGVDVTTTNSWYRSTGSGMGPTLNIAAGMNAYALTDRGTWLSFQNRQDLAILVEGDNRLFNQYGVMVVSPKKHPHVKAEEAQRFADWIVAPAGQAAIANFKIGGDQLFFPNAQK